MRARMAPVGIISAITAGSGIVNLLTVMRPHFHPPGPLVDLFPIEFLHVSRLLSLLIGFGLVISAVNLLKRKRRAFMSAALLSAITIPFHLLQGLDHRGAVVSAFLLILLVLTRRSFTVRSELPDLSFAIARLAVFAAAAFTYGVFGFWILDRRHFGIEFNLVDSIHSTIRFLTFVGDVAVVPRTHYARWFLDSLYLATVAGIVYAVLSLYRPVLYRLRIHTRELAMAAEIVRHHGRSALDFFKYWPDKSIYFSPSQRSFLAYRVGGKHAIVLGDPVGPEEEIEDLVRQFQLLCDENDWGLAFHQVGPDFLPLYARVGMHKLKIGDDAIIDLRNFNLEGRTRKEFRNTIARLEKAGVSSRLLAPPISEGDLSRIQEVSDEWLTLPGHRERRFTLGLYDPAYVRSTPVIAAEDAEGRLLGFLNLIPSFAKREASIDLMRRRTEAPNGLMDYLFVKLFLTLSEQGYERFNFGLAPMAGFQEREVATREERAIHAFFQRMTFLFSYTGLRAYKAKFASSWEPRYLIYRNALDLPAVAIAIGRVSERGGHEDEQPED